MDWFRYIDIYCERSNPGFWDEPLNAVTNGAFLIAAMAAAVHIRGNEDARRDRSLWALCGLVAVIGAGSFAFHTFAQFWAMLADVIPISIFTYGYLGYALRRYSNARWPATLAIVAAFVTASFGLDGAVPADVLNGSVGYLPAVLGLFAVAAALARSAHPAALRLAMAGAILSVSLVFRTLDNALCVSWPMGTHFFWHCLNALMLYVLLRTAADYGVRRASQ